MSDEREQKWQLREFETAIQVTCGDDVLIELTSKSWDESDRNLRIAKHIVDLQNASLKPIKWTHDKALAQCPCCASADVGAAGLIAHCYKCGLEIRGDSHQHTLDKWNTRDGVLLEPPEA